jgi:outer membrane protein assembly factor BamD (BamD/ComL family)
LLEKYPSSSYKEKINRHIVIIEEELAKLRRESG